MPRFIHIILLLLISSVSAQAQIKVTGTFTDESDRAPLVGVSVQLVSQNDTIVRRGAVTNLDGRFEIYNIPKGNYTLRANYIGYKEYIRQIILSSDSLNIGTIPMIPDAVMMKDVIIKGRQVIVQQIGDTTQFNANAYKTNPDATAEDLVKKMPGVTTENGQVKVQGENVQQVLVDGKPFFGDDPNVALKNMPAEVIDKIQVFDRGSDQQQFTGFNDGNTSKTINIITKPGKNKGQFGRMYAGYGTDNRYTAGGNVNFFKGDRRISVLGLSNNINQQNFSADDLLGLSGGGNSGRGRGGFGGGGNRGSGGGSLGDFLTGERNGIARTNSLGINYSNTFGKKVTLSGSYFFNDINNTNFTLLRRQYITTQDSGLLYNENSQAGSENMNHRLNLRIEYNIDSTNSFILTPRINLSDNFTRTNLLGRNISNENAETSRTQSDYNAGNFGYRLYNGILYRHKFKKAGRTFSLGVDHEHNPRSGRAHLNSRNWYNLFSDSLFIDQNISTISGSNNLNTNISYTEPLDSTSQLMFTYNPSYTASHSNRQTTNFDFVNQQYSGLDSALSNRFENTYFTNRGGISYRKNKGKYNYNIGLNYQHARLQGNQLYPVIFSVDKTFSNLLPSAMYHYRFTKNSNIRLHYRTNTNAPGINQLQHVIDNNNPLLLRTGNPELRQSYTHTLSSRYGSSNTVKGTSFMWFLMGSYMQDFIGNSTYLARRDSAISETIILARGSQLSKPVNLDGYWSIRTFLNYGLPVSFLKSNLNLNSGFNYNQTPALISERMNFANNYNFSQGAVLSSNISEKIDFTLSYSANYSIVENTLQRQADNNYFFQNSSARVNWIPYKGLVINTSVNHTNYSGISRDINNDFLLVNASLGYKFLKNQSLEAKLSVYDLLNENTSINRNVTETYIEDSENNVLNRFFMLTLTYSLRRFGTPPQNQNQQEDNSTPRRRNWQQPNQQP